MRTTKNLKCLTPIIVEWFDAYSGSTTQQDTVDQILLETLPMLRNTVGWYLGVRHNYLVLATDWDGDRNIGLPHYIPMAMVRAIKPLITKKI